MEVLIFFGSVAVLVVWGFVAAEFRRIAAMKGHDQARYFWWTFLLGLVGILMVIALPHDGGAQPAAAAATPPVREDEIPEI